MPEVAQIKPVSGKQQAPTYKEQRIRPDSKQKPGKDRFRVCFNFRDKPPKIYSDDSLPFVKVIQFTTTANVNLHAFSQFASNIFYRQTAQPQGKLDRQNSR